MNVPAVLERLGATTRWRQIEHHPVVTSTNTLAAERAATGAGTGLVVVADQQTAGRGRLGRTWRDQPAGSLAVTCLADAPAEPGTVPMAVGLAVVAGTRAQGVVTTLKWPNDVLAAGRKCAGILIETVAGGRLAIGIGVNVDWRDRSGGDVPAAWGSLAEAAGGDIDRTRLLSDLLAALDARLDQCQGAAGDLLDDYRLSCATIGAQVRVELADAVVRGVARDVTSSGALVVGTPAGDVTVTAGDVRHVRTR